MILEKSEIVYKQEKKMNDNRSLNEVLDFFQDEENKNTNETIEPFITTERFYNNFVNGIGDFGKDLQKKSNELKKKKPQTSKEVASILIDMIPYFISLPSIMFNTFANSNDPLIKSIMNGVSASQSGYMSKLLKIQKEITNKIDKE